MQNLVCAIQAETTNLCHAGNDVDGGGDGFVLILFPFNSAHIWRIFTTVNSRRRRVVDGNANRCAKTSLYWRHVAHTRQLANQRRGLIWLAKASTWRGRASWLTACVRDVQSTEKNSIVVLKSFAFVVHVPCFLASSVCGKFTFTKRFKWSTHKSFEVGCQILLFFFRKYYKRDQ